MALRKETVKKRGKVTKKSPSEQSFEVRCRKMEKLQSANYPEQKESIKKLYNAMIEYDPVGVAEILENYLSLMKKKRNIGKISKKMSDDFAISIGEDLNQVRNDGYKSLRKIADRFNELGIKSFYGREWSHTTVKNLIHRRKELGLE
ncbi:MAG: recombinase family protein [Cyclobacteriaceae bacterium]